MKLIENYEIESKEAPKTFPVQTPHVWDKSKTKTQVSLGGGGLLLVVGVLKAQFGLP